MKSPLKSQHMPEGLKKINPQREVEKPCEKRRNVKGHVDSTLTTEWVYVQYTECERCAERRGEHIARTKSREQSERSSQSPQQMLDNVMSDTTSSHEEFLEEYELSTGNDDKQNKWLRLQ